MTTKSKPTDEMLMMDAASIYPLRTKDQTTEETLIDKYIAREIERQKQVQVVIARAREVVQSADKPRRQHHAAASHLQQHVRSPAGMRLVLLFARSFFVRTHALYDTTRAIPA